MDFHVLKYFNRQYTTKLLGFSHEYIGCTDLADWNSVRFNNGFDDSCFATDILLT